MGNTGKKNDFKDGKLRWDLLPLQDLEEVVGLYTFGTLKYGENNWQKLENGESRYRAALFRHLLLHIKGERIDPESGYSHLAAVIWNAIAMYHCHNHQANGTKTENETILNNHEKFLLKAKEVHGDKYDYSSVAYVNNRIKIGITCPVHGIFFQSPNDHLTGYGCPKCRIDSFKKMLYGVGINDTYFSAGTPLYNTWSDMLRRCYSYKWKEKHPCYIDCKVCEDWHILSNFKTWFDKNYKPGCSLDKDLLSNGGGKLYSPDTCCFIPHDINKMIPSPRPGRKLPLGVFFKKDRNKYGISSFRLGYYKTPEEAFEKYKSVIKDRLKHIAEEYFEKGIIDRRVFEALLRYEIRPYCG